MSVKTNLASTGGGGGSTIQGDAVPGDVLLSKTFMSASSLEVQTGTMPNNGSVSTTLNPTMSAQSYTIPQGYHDGTGKVNVTAVPLSGNADASNVLASKTFYSNNLTQQTGSMTNRGSWSQTVTPTDSVQEVIIPEGFHNGSGKVTVNASTVLQKITFQVGGSAKGKWNGSGGATVFYSNYVDISCAGYSKVTVTNAYSSSDMFCTAVSDFTLRTNYNLNGASTYRVGRMHINATSQSAEGVGAVFVNVTLIP